MMPHEPVRDIMRRTMHNLRFVEAHQGPDGPYEVTQLLNSFLGALAHPWEKYHNELCAKSLAEAAATGWPKISSDRDPQSLGDLVRLMRNAVAHGNVDYLPGPAGEIQAHRIWNLDRGRRTWNAVISVAQMRAFLMCFVQLAETLGEEQRGPGLRIA
jgi:HEPN pEK499 p136